MAGGVVIVPPTDLSEKVTIEVATAVALVTVTGPHPGQVNVPTLDDGSTTF